MKFYRLVTIFTLLIILRLHVHAISVEVGDESQYSMIETFNAPSPVLRCDEQIHLCFIYSPTNSSLNVYDLQKLQVIQKISIEEDNVKEIHLIKHMEQTFIILQCTQNQMLIYALDNPRQGILHSSQQDNNRMNQSHLSQQGPIPFQQGQKNDHGPHEINQRNNVIFQNFPFIVCSGKIFPMYQIVQEIKIQSKNIQINKQLKRDPRSGRQLHEIPDQSLSLLISNETRCSKIKFFIIRLDMTNFYKRDHHSPQKKFNAADIQEIKIEKFPLQLQEKGRQIVKSTLSNDQRIFICVDDSQEVGFLALHNLVNPHLEEDNTVRELPEILTINYNVQFQVKKLDSSYQLQSLIKVQENQASVTLVYQSKKSDEIVIDTLIYCSQLLIVIDVKRQFIHNFNQDIIVSSLTSSLAQRSHQKIQQIQQENTTFNRSGVENTKNSSNLTSDSQFVTKNHISHIQMSKKHPSQFGGIVLSNSEGVQFFIKKCSIIDETFSVLRMDCQKDIFCINQRVLNSQQICLTEVNWDSGNFRAQNAGSHQPLKFVKRIMMRYQTSFDLEQLLEEHKIKIILVSILLIGFGCYFQERIQNCFQRNKKDENEIDIDNEQHQIQNNQNNNVPSLPKLANNQVERNIQNNFDIEMGQVDKNAFEIESDLLNQNFILESQNKISTPFFNNQSIDYAGQNRFFPPHNSSTKQKRIQQFFPFHENIEEQNMEEEEEQEEEKQENSDLHYRQEYLEEYYIDRFCYNQKSTQNLNKNQNQVFGFEQINRDNQNYHQSQSQEHNLNIHFNQDSNLSNGDNNLNQESDSASITDPPFNSTSLERQSDYCSSPSFDAFKTKQLYPINNLNLCPTQKIKLGNQNDFQIEQGSRKLMHCDQELNCLNPSIFQINQMQNTDNQSNQMSATNHIWRPLNQQQSGIKKFQNQKNQISEEVDQNSLKQIYSQLNDKDFIMSPNELITDVSNISFKKEEIENKDHFIKSQLSQNCNLGQKIQSRPQQFIRYLKIDPSACHYLKAQKELFQIPLNQKSLFNRNYFQQQQHSSLNTNQFEDKHLQESEILSNQEEEDQQIEQVEQEEEEEEVENQDLLQEEQEEKGISLSEESQLLSTKHIKSIIKELSCNSQVTRVGNHQDSNLLLSKRSLKREQKFKYQRQLYSVRKSQNNFINRVEQFYSSHSKYIKLEEEDQQPQFRQTLNCFTQRSCFNQIQESLMYQRKFKSQIQQISSSDPHYQIQKSNQPKRISYLKPKVIESYNQLNHHKKQQSYNLEKSDFFYNCENHQNSLTFSTHQSNNIKSCRLESTNANQKQQFQNQVKSTIINRDFNSKKNSISTSANTTTTNNLPQSTNNSYSSHSMWPLTFQEQSTNFEEEILNQMDLSGSTNSQSNSSILNSDFQGQRFMDNFLEQMGPSRNQENINKYDPFLWGSETNEKSFLSASSNEFGDTVKKIRHINNDFQQQEFFDIKDFQFISETLFEESQENKKQKDINKTIINNPLTLPNIFDQGNQMEKLQKMTEQINNEFLLSCANLLNISKNI